MKRYKKMKKINYKMNYIKYSKEGFIYEKGAIYNIEPLSCFTVSSLLYDKNYYRDFKILEVKNIKRDLTETEISDILEITIDSVGPSNVSALCEVVTDVLTITDTIRGYDPKDVKSVQMDDIQRNDKIIKYYNQKAIDYTVKGNF